MTRILHVAAVDFTAAKLLLPQLSWLRQEGYDVRIACQRTDDRYWQELLPFNPVHIDLPRSLKPVAMLKAARCLAREVAEWRPDVLHLHTPAASLPIRAIPHPGWATSTKTVYTVHGFLHQWPPHGLLERVVQKVEKWEARRTAALLFQSAEDFDMTTRERYRTKLILLGNGVQDSWFSIPTRSRSGPLQLLFVGRTVREKGVLELLEAVSLVSNVELHMAGEALASDRDPVVAQVREWLDQRELQGRVTLHGMLSGPELQGLMAEMDALCLPSYREGVPRSIIEALAASRPVIASDIRGCNELIVPGINGYLVPAGEVHGLAAAIRRMVDLNENEFTRFATRARESVEPDRRESEVFARLSAAYATLGVTP